MVKWLKYDIYIYIFLFPLTGLVCLLLDHNTFVSVLSLLINKSKVTCYLKS